MIMIKYERVGVYRGGPNGKTNTLHNDKEMAQEREREGRRCSISVQRFSGDSMLVWVLLVT